MLVYLLILTLAFPPKSSVHQSCGPCENVPDQRTAFRVPVCLCTNVSCADRVTPITWHSVCGDTCSPTFQTFPVLCLSTGITLMGPTMGHRGGKSSNVLHALRGPIPLSGKVILRVLHPNASPLEPIGENKNWTDIFICLSCIQIVLGFSRSIA